MSVCMRVCCRAGNSGAKTKKRRRSREEDGAFNMADYLIIDGLMGRGARGASRTAARPAQRRLAGGIRGGAGTTFAGAEGAASPGAVKARGPR